MSPNSSINSSHPSANCSQPDHSQFTIPITICLMTVLICLVGLIGNGITIYFFCFRIKLNQSTVYILNLAVADFILVFGCCMVTLFFLCLYNGVRTSQRQDAVFSVFGNFLNSFGFNSSLFFLAALSIERSLSVCFPIWYKCRRPEHLSAILSVIIWIASFLITVLERFLISQYRSIVYVVISILFLIVTLAMIGASAILLIQIQKTSVPYRPMKLYIVVVAAVTTFLISLVPATIVRLLFFFALIPTGRTKILSYLAISLCSALNSTVNPYIYIIVGRWKKSLPATQAFESVFKEDRRTSEGSDRVQTQDTDIEH